MAHFPHGYFIKCDIKPRLAGGSREVEKGTINRIVSKSIV